MKKILFDTNVVLDVLLDPGCECIVTRDLKGFRGYPVRSLTPEALMPLLREK
jgi:hypothetical protein